VILLPGFLKFLLLLVDDSEEDALLLRLSMKKALVRP
jgi:hypothetical protein